METLLRATLPSITVLRQLKNSFVAEKSRVIFTRPAFCRPGR